MYNEHGSLTFWLKIILDRLQLPLKAISQYANIKVSIYTFKDISVVESILQVFFFYKP